MVMLFLSSLLLFVAGVTAIACAIAVSGILALASIHADPGVPILAGLEDV